MSVVHLSVGGVTPTGAVVKAKTTGSSARLAVSTSSSLTSPTYFGPVSPTNSIVTLTASGLTANTRYYYGIEDDGVLDTATTGKFRTFPVAGSAASFTCVVSSCAGTSASADLIATGVSNRAIFDTIRNLDPLFFAHQGDRSYVNRATNDVAGFRTDYDTVMSASRQHHLYRDVPTVYVWDDHDFGDNDCDGTVASKPAVSQVFRERIPTYSLPDASSTGAIYHSFECGRVLFIVADTRHDKSPDTDPDDSSKTLLGTAQKAWMQGVLETSSAKALVWLNGTPWMGLSADTWAGYETEKQELVDMFTATGWLDRMVTCNGDNHSLGMDTGGGNAFGGFPVWMWGSMDSPATGVSTQYDMGPTSPGIDRYGTIEVVDTGGDEITLTGTGYIGTTPWRSYTLTIPLGTGAVTPPRTVALLYDPVLSRVRLNASGLAVGADHVDIDRSTNARTWTPVRAGVDRDVSSSSVTSDALNTNPYFETDASGWVMSSGDTIARSTTRAHEGTASALLTSDGSGASLTCTSTNATDPTTTAGIAYTASAWVYSVAGWSSGVEVGLVWVDNTDAVLSVTFGTSTAIPAATWTHLTVTDTPPAGAVKVGVRIAILGTPPAGTQLWVDEAKVTDEIVDNTVSVDDYEFAADVANYYRIRTYDVADSLLEEFVTVTTPTLDSVWIKSLVRPFLNRAVKVATIGDVSRSFRGGVFDVVGRSAPVAVTDLRSSRRFDLTVSTLTLEDATNLDLLLASGDPLFVQAPTTHPLIGGYFVAGDTAQARKDVPWDRRWTTLPLTEVAAPGPDVYGATITWSGILGAFDTWQDVLDAQATWASLLELIGSPSDVVVT